MSCGKTCREDRDDEWMGVSLARQPRADGRVLVRPPRIGGVGVGCCRERAGTPRVSDLDFLGKLGGMGTRAWLQGCPQYTAVWTKDGSFYFLHPSDNVCPGGNISEMHGERTW